MRPELLTVRKAASIHPARLGATLYVPATRGDLLAIALGHKYPSLRSVVFDLEDAVLPRDIGHAMANLAALLLQLERSQLLHGDRPLLFVRPRDAAMLAHLSALPGIAQITGFVIPKATADVMPAYISSLSCADHVIMPTIETREAFDSVEMRRLREQLIAIQDRVLAVRIGGNDLLQTLGCRRSTRRTAYDGLLGKIIGNLVAGFVPWGFAMSAPVLENFTDMAMLQDEIDQDIEHGLFTKTAIHPAQVDMIHAAYMVDEAVHANAVQILDVNAPAIFACDGIMSEPATHRAWARAVIERADAFGVRKPEGPGLALVV